MSASFQAVASTGGPQFDVPPIAPANQTDQQAAPFSQLLSQVQSAAPISASPSPSTVPAPPPAPKSNATPQAGGSDPNDSSAGPSAAPEQASDNNSTQSTSGPNGVTPNGSDESQSEATSPATGTDQPRQARPDYQQAQAAKKGDTSSPQPSTAQPALQPTDAAASNLSSQLAAKSGDATKAKGGEKSSDGKKGGSDQSSDAALSTTPDAGTQAAAAAVATLAAAVPVEPDVQAATKAKAVAAKQSAKQTATQAGATPKPQTMLLPANVQATASVQTTTDVPAAAGSLPVHAKNDNVASAADQAAKPNAPAGTSQTDTIAALASVAVSLPQAADVVTTVAAVEAPVVSTITIDASTTAVTPNSGESAPSATTGSPPESSPPNNAVSATPSAFAATMTQNAASGSSPATGLSTIDRARFVQRVASAFQSVGDQGGQIRLRLSPPDLGSLQMQISVKQGVLSATIQADNSTTQQVLLDSLPDLRDRLAQQDIRIERFDVQLMGQGSGGMPQPQSNPDFNQTPTRGNGGRVASTPSTSPESNPSPSISSLTSAGALNVVV